MHRIQMRRDLGQRDVRRLVDQREDLLGMGLDPMRAVIPALAVWSDITHTPPPIEPFDRRRRRNTEALGRGAPRKAILNRRYQSGSNTSLQKGSLMGPVS